ncbi:MAG TPA: aldehyde dehydrogenase family protein, partial [Usitatibacter sp.]|nr:aldehyde dehydrogenase family protein [Usitatibacter sp.]
MLEGAMAELRLGNPEELAVDVGPVIDADAASMLESHIAAMRKGGLRVRQAERHVGLAARLPGTFVVPTVIEIESLDQLEREVFGPVLHVLRYRREDTQALVEAINRLGYGLTLGIHSRVDGTIDAIVRAARVGNVYVNRNMIGAVVGVQPFGGEGLSGTGPKAGGPLYLHRFVARSPDDAALAELRAIDADATRGDRADAALESLAAWCSASGFHAAATLAARLRQVSPAGITVVLPGPTGERNTYSVLPRESVLCVAGDVNALLAQTVAVLSLGGHAVWDGDVEECRLLHARLPEAVGPRIRLASDWRREPFDAALHSGDDAQGRELALAIAAREGPIVGVHAFDPHSGRLHLERLLVERVASVNTAAAGGNASLMTIG